IPLPDFLQEGLIAHMPLDEATGTETANAVAGQPDGSYQGVGRPEWVGGVVGRALQLNGNGRIEFATWKQPDKGEPHSIGCWFYTPHGSGRGCLVGKYDQGGFALQSDPGNSTVIA